jgi:hypothetical protein
MKCMFLLFVPETNTTFIHGFCIGDERKPKCRHCEIAARTCSFPSVARLDALVGLDSDATTFDFPSDHIWLETPPARVYSLRVVLSSRTDVPTVRFVYQVKHIQDDEDSESPDEALSSDRTLETALVTPGIYSIFWASTGVDSHRSHCNRTIKSGCDGRHAACRRAPDDIPFAWWSLRRTRNEFYRRLTGAESAFKPFYLYGAASRAARRSGQSAVDETLYGQPHRLGKTIFLCQLNLELTSFDSWT